MEREIKGFQKRVLLLFGCVIGVVIGIFVFQMITKTAEDATKYTSVIQINWKLSLPTNYIEIYEKDSGPSPHGDGTRYHIFQYEETATMNNLFSWSHGGFETNYADSCKDAVTELLESLEVPQEYYPDFQKGRYWYKNKEDSSELILCWNAQTGVLYVVENFL